MIRLRIALAALLLAIAPALLGAQAPAPNPASESHPPAVSSPSGAPTEETLDPRREEVVKRVASELRCPVCQGLSVQDSPTELAQQMKAVIRRQLAEGKSPDEVRAYFVARYGEWILLEPRAKGFNLVLYLLPLAGIAAGAAVIAVFVRRMTSRSGEPAPYLGDEPAPHA